MPARPWAWPSCRSESPSRSRLRSRSLSSARVSGPVRAPRLGRRIVVYGPTGSGKTTVARRIGELLGLPVVELDAIFWRPNWEPTPADEFRANALDTLREHDGGWVCEGNYSMLRGTILPMADTVVWLRFPFRVAYWRLLKRTVSRAWTREPLWGTNRESWRQSFLSRESILLWGISHWRAHHRNVRTALREIPHRATVVELRSAPEVNDLLASLVRRPVDDTRPMSDLGWRNPT